MTLPFPAWRSKLHEVIFEAETKAGKTFDVALLIAIVASVVAVMLESVKGIREHWGLALLAIEWGLTGLFTIEYLLRLLAVRRPMAYARSFFGIVDVLAILPTWLSLFLPGSQALLVVRALRLLRIFRILKLGAFLAEASSLSRALKASRRKITLFLGFVSVLVLILGSLIYLVEGEAHGFTSIPISVYWAIVTLTTVGYGDISPQTPLGQFVAALVMILGYAILAVPTGIVTSELVRERQTTNPTTQACPSCSAEAHNSDARFCRICGHRL